MNALEVARLKAVLPNTMYYHPGGEEGRRTQGIYCKDEHDQLLRIYGAWDANTVVESLLKHERSIGQDEGRLQVYRQMATAIGLDVQMQELRQELAEVKDQVAQAVHAAMR